MLAQRVHVAPSRVLLGLFTMSLTAACILPPSLSVNQDAGVNSPPAITAVRSNDQELPEPGPVNFVTGPSAGTMSISLVDTDVEDTLYVRLFVNYLGTKTPSPRSNCTAAPTMTSLRTTTCTLTAICTDTEVGLEGGALPGSLYLTVQVFDREPDDFLLPAFKTMPEDQNGMTTSRGYLMNCQDPS